MASLGGVLVILAFVFRAATEHGLDAAGGLRGLAVVVVLQVAPGIVVWRAIRPARGSWLEDVVVGGSLGFVAAIVAVAMPGPVLVPSVAFPAAALALLVHRPSRQRVVARSTAPLPIWVPLATAAPALLLVPGTLRFFRSNPVAWSEGFRSFYVDMPFHLSLAGQLAHRGPATVPYVVSEPLQYHWFSHAWVAQVGVTANVELDQVLLRLLPVIVVVATPVAVAAVTLRLTDWPWAPPLASLLAVAAADLTVFTARGTANLVYHLSPSLATSVCLSAGLVIVLAVRWSEVTVSRAGRVVLVLLAMAIAGTKGSALPVLVVGAAVATAAALQSPTHRPLARRIAGDTVTLIGALVVTSLVVFGGSSPGLALDPSAALRQAVAPLLEATDDPGVLTLVGAGALLTVSAMARGIGVLPLLAARRRATSPFIAFLLGTGLAGAGAVVIFAHDGLSQFYFLRNAAPWLAVASALGIASARDTARWRFVVGGGVGMIVGLGAVWIRYQGLTNGDNRAARQALFGLGLVIGAMLFAAGLAQLGRIAHRLQQGALAASVVLLTVVTVPSVAHLATMDSGPVDAPVEPGSPLAVSRDQITAARWLRDRSASDALVATNRHCNGPSEPRCDNRRFSVAAYTERQLLVEGWGYTTQTALRAREDLDDAYVPYWREDVLTANDAFFDNPSPASTQRLRDLGVEWVFVDKTVPFDPAIGDDAELRYDTPYARVFHLGP